MNVLIVDDLPTNRKLLRAMLESDELTLFEAGDGLQALAVLEQAPIDAIISDVLMPRMDGYRLCQEVRRHPRFGNVPFLFYTGTYTSTDDAKAARELGADRFLSKPVSRKALLAILQEITAGSRQSVSSPVQRVEAAERRATYNPRLVQKLERRHDALAQSHRQLSALVNGIGGILWEADAEPFRPTFLSGQAERLLGYPLQRLRQPDFWFRIVHPEDRERVRAERAAQARSLTARELEYRVTTARGQTVWVHESVSALHDPSQGPKLCGITIDATAKRQAEEALRLLVERLPDGVLVNCEGRIAFANPAALKVLGADRPDELLGKAALDLVHPGGREQARQRIERVLAGAEVAPEQETLLRLDGTPVEVETTLIPFTHQGKPAVQVILCDHAERKRLEAQLRHAQKLEAIGQLAGGVAHDFNNVLTVIQLQAASLLSSEALSEKAAESAREIAFAAERAAGLTRQLLAFSRKQLTQMADLDLNGLVANLIKMLQRLLGEDVQLELSFSPAHPLIQADAGMIEQVLLNLAVNARDAMPRGGRLRIQTETLSLDEAGAQANPEARPGEFVCLSVSDTGQGIAPEHLPRLFEPFFSTKGVGEGTGLGLATVYGIVKQHQGWITVESRLGHGSTFRVFLPRSLGPAAALEASPARPLPLAGGREAILLVEDEEAVRRVVRSILEGLGYRVFEAESGVAALAVWRKRRGEIALVLTDMVMPEGLTGCDLAEKLWAEAPNLPVILTSGYSAQIAGQQRGLGEGVPFLQKPYSPETLATVLRDALDGSGRPRPAASTPC
jgi:two-component system, cell cycle sensor histidine kinase and response regulator CckA